MEILMCRLLESMLGFIVITTANDALNQVEERLEKWVRTPWNAFEVVYSQQHMFYDR